MASHRKGLPGRRIRPCCRKFERSRCVQRILTGAKYLSDHHRPLFRRERDSAPASSFEYLVDCPDGVYEITLLEVETSWTNVNQRVLDVPIEGQPVLADFDIFGGETNAVQAASNLVGVYSDIRSNVIVPGLSLATINYLDIGAATSSPTRFYRIRLVPRFSFDFASLRG